MKRRTFVGILGTIAMAPVAVAKSLKKADSHLIGANRASKKAMKGLMGVEFDRRWVDEDKLSEEFAKEMRWVTDPYPIRYGKNGQVLSSDHKGNLRWINPDGTIFQEGYCGKRATTE